MKYSTQVLFSGLFLALVVIIISIPSVQGSVVRLLGLDRTFAIQGETPQLERAWVDRVVDGDTIILTDGRKIRFLNVDTPESVKDSQNPQCYSKEAYEFTRNLLARNEVVLQKDIEPLDQYGRELRLVYRANGNPENPETSVSGELIKNGFGRAVSYKPNTTHSDLFMRLERKAKDANLGVWNCPNPFEE